MTKLLVILSLMISSLNASLAQEANPDEAPPITNADTPAMTTEINEERSFNSRKSHWLSSFGFETLKYDVPVNYNGVREDFEPYQQELWGGRLGVGGELYLGAGFNLTTKVESFYLGTLFSKVYNAGPYEEAQDFAYIKKTGSVWGVEATQSLGFLFNLKTKNPFLDEWTYLTVEPFVEAGVGRAWAYNRLAYEFNTGASGTDEGYRVRVRDELANTKFGGGINFTSQSGYFLYIKSYVNNFNVLKRSVTTYSRPNQGAGSTSTEEPKDVKIDAITTYAIGGGYKF